MKKEQIRPDRNGNGFWWVPKGVGKGTENDPHIHDTIHIDEEGNILNDSHTSIIVNGKIKRINY